MTAQFSASPEFEPLLHGFVDGALERAVTLATSKRLEDDPAAFALADAWSRQNTALRCAFLPLAQDKEPVYLKTSRLTTWRQPNWRPQNESEDSVYDSIQLVASNVPKATMENKPISGCLEETFKDKRAALHTVRDDSGSAPASFHSAPAPEGSCNPCSASPARGGLSPSADTATPRGNAIRRIVKIIPSMLPVLSIGFVLISGALLGVTLDAMWRQNPALAQKQAARANLAAYQALAFAYYELKEPMEQELGLSSDAERLSHVSAIVEAMGAPWPLARLDTPFGHVVAAKLVPGLNRQAAFFILEDSFGARSVLTLEPLETGSPLSSIMAYRDHRQTAPLINDDGGAQGAGTGASLGNYALVRDNFVVTITGINDRTKLMDFLNTLLAPRGEVSRVASLTP